jgi:hypothetical protein
LFLEIIEFGQQVCDSRRKEVSLNRMRNPTLDLIELRHYYENIVAQSESQSTQAKEQIKHIDALLVNSLLQAQEPITRRADLLDDLPVRAAITPAPEADPKPRTKRPSQSSVQPVPTAETVSETKVKLKVAKGARGRESYPLLPAYDGLNKLEAISQILSEQSDRVLHQDTITQLLYGELSPEVLKVESRRMRASLFQGVTKNLWQRAPNQPSSYVANTNNGRQLKSADPDDRPASAEPKAQRRSKAPEQSSAPSVALSGKPGRKSTALAKSNAATGGDRVAPVKPASRGRTQVLSLPAQYAGLSKIDAVAKVLEENAGTVMHMNEIIERLYGQLADDVLKSEKVRMKDVMTRGVQRQLWNKAKGAPSSIVIGETSQPSPLKEKKAAKATVTQLKPATAKKPRKAAPAKPMAKTKRKKAEVVALLRNANIKI